LMLVVFLSFVLFVVLYYKHSPNSGFNDFKNLSKANPGSSLFSERERRV